MEYGKQIGHLVRLVSNMWKRELDSRTDTTGVECLSGVQIGILEFINEMYEQDTAIYQKDIESEFKVRRSTVSVILKTMEDRGLVDRISVESDARLKRIIPTDLAMQHRLLTKSIVDGLSESIVEGIPEEDLKTFIDVAKKMIDYLENISK